MAPSTSLKLWSAMTLSRCWQWDLYMPMKACACSYRTPGESWPATERKSTERTDVRRHRDNRERTPERERKRERESKRNILGSRGGNSGSWRAVSMCGFGSGILLVRCAISIDEEDVVMKKTGSYIEDELTIAVCSG